MNRFGAERETVQRRLIEYASQIGWTELDPATAGIERRGSGGGLLYRALEEKLIELNPGIVTADNVAEVVQRIDNTKPDIEGNFDVLRWLRGERTLRVPAENRTRNVMVIDFERPERNVYHVTEEWEARRRGNRADVMFLVNGIPVAIVETKSAKKPNPLELGIIRFRRYHAESPDLVKSPQVFDITNLLGFHYGVTWNLERKNIFDWKDEQKGDFETRLKAFFDRHRFLDMLEHWIVFYKKDDELQKIILRQHQTRAVFKAVQRALDPEKRRGLVWHTQGSGKTFTMIAVAEQLLEHGRQTNDKPTVIMVVDRTELEQQLFSNLTGYGLPAIVARSKTKLRNLLRNDYRGLIVAMMHKFEGADANVSDRSNITILIDEAHRSTGGSLGNYLMGALPNATLIGFTGTPINKTEYGEGTFKVFGGDDAPAGYLDKYSIRESIEDGTTLQIHYALAPSEMLVPKDVLNQEFLELTKAEGVTEIEELNAILDRAVRLKALLTADDHIDKVARFVADHFRHNVEPLGYKAFVVAYNRKACALYKEALDRYLPSRDYSAVVYTSSNDDEPLIRKYALSEDDEKAIRKAFLGKTRQPVTVAGTTYPPGQPKILIVTEKLLTGFDAPMLYCMYLDKPMRDHTLLQAIARVNRPYARSESEKDVKQAGLVIDFIGIFDRIEKALKFDDDEVASVISNLDELKTAFAGLMSGAEARELLALTALPFDDKGVERAVEHFAEREIRDAFFRFFKSIERLYEIISPDAFMRPFEPDYARLAALYAVIRANFTGERFLDELPAKTEDLVRREAVVSGLEEITESVRIDETTLDALQRRGTTSRPKIINLARRLVQTIRDHPNQAVLIPIGDRVEDVLDRLDDRLATTEEALSDIRRAVEEYVEAQRERERLGLDDRTFAFYRTMKDAGLEPVAAQEAAGVIEALFARYPEHVDNSLQRRSVKAELYRELLQLVDKDAASEVAERVMRIAESA